MDIDIDIMCVYIYIEREREKTDIILGQGRRAGRPAVHDPAGALRLHRLRGLRRDALREIYR